MITGEIKNNTVLEIQRNGEVLGNRKTDKSAGRQKRRGERWSR